MLSAGFRPTVCAPHSIEDGINSVRATLPRSYFDEAECATGLRHLRAYRKDWDEQRGCWKDKPRHDQTSHASDALRYMCMVSHEVRTETVEPTTKEIIRDMCKPKTLAGAWKEYADELRERDDGELPEDYEHFNLSNKNLEFE
jgi:hypothetical protein